MIPQLALTFQFSDKSRNNRSVTVNVKVWALVEVLKFWTIVLVQKLKQQRLLPFNIPLWLCKRLTSFNYITTNLRDWSISWKALSAKSFDFLSSTILQQLPQSINFTLPILSSIMFAVLISRCSIPFCSLR